MPSARSAPRRQGTSSTARQPVLVGDGIGRAVRHPPAMEADGSVQRHGRAREHKEVAAREAEIPDAATLQVQEVLAVGTVLRADRAQPQLASLGVDLQLQNDRPAPQDRTAQPDQDAIVPDGEAFDVEPVLFRGQLQEVAPDACRPVVPSSRATAFRRREPGQPGIAAGQASRQGSAAVSPASGMRASVQRFGFGSVSSSFLMPSPRLHRGRACHASWHASPRARDVALELPSPRCRLSLPRRKRESDEVGRGRTRHACHSDPAHRRSAGPARSLVRAEPQGVDGRRRRSTGCLERPWSARRGRMVEVEPDGADASRAVPQHEASMGGMGCLFAAEGAGVRKRQPAIPRAYRPSACMRRRFHARVKRARRAPARGARSRAS